MRIMTSNIWGDYFGNPPRGRDENLLTVYARYSPDVIGFQEVTRAWYESALFEKLSEGYYFLGTECIDSKNAVPMAVKKEFSLLAKGFEYLEGTPDESKAITWGVVEKDGKRFALCNTHFWWMKGGESEETKRHHGVLSWSAEDHHGLRAKNAEQLSRLMQYLHARYLCPVFAFGDMNAPIYASIFEVFAQNGIRKLFDLAKERDTAATIHGDPQRTESGAYRGKEAAADYLARVGRKMGVPEGLTEGYHFSIDHIVGLGDDLTVCAYRVIRDREALDATDHSPVFADIL